MCLNTSIASFLRRPTLHRLCCCHCDWNCLLATTTVKCQEHYKFIFMCKCASTQCLIYIRCVIRFDCVEDATFWSDNNNPCTASGVILPRERDWVSGEVISEYRDQFILECFPVRQHTRLSHLLSPHQSEVRARCAGCEGCVGCSRWSAAATNLGTYVSCQCSCNGDVRIPPTTSP